MNFIAYFYIFFFQKPIIIMWCSKFVVLMQILMTFNVKMDLIRCKNMKSGMSREFDHIEGH